MFFVGHTHVDHIGFTSKVNKRRFLMEKLSLSHATAQFNETIIYIIVLFILLSEANALSFKYKRNYSPILHRRGCSYDF